MPEELNSNLEAMQQPKDEIKFYKNPSSMPEGQKIGLSLSFCVSQILRGDIRVHDVDKIYAATNAQTQGEWQDLMASYKQTYWDSNPESAEQIATELKNEGKIIQPRVEGKQGHNISKGHWIMATDEQEWLKQYSS